MELFLNGASLGRRPAGARARNTASFDMVYEPGELRAVAYRGGFPAGEDTVATCGSPYAIRLEADRQWVRPVRSGLAYVTASVVDDKGGDVPYADNELHFEASGEGEILALGTADPLSGEPFDGHSRRAYEGTVLVILHASGRSGEIALEARAEGLEPARLALPAYEA